MYTLSRKESQAVNILRVIFTVMVVYIHVHVGSEKILTSSDVIIKNIEFTISEVICRCAVPGFYLISSIMLYKKAFTWKSNMKKKVSGILIPYLIMNTFWIVFFLIAKKISFVSSFFATDASDIYHWGIKQWLNAYLGFDGLPVLGQTWFLRDLFVINLFAVVLKFIIDKIPRIWFIIISLLWLFNIEIPVLFISGSTLVFFSLGYYVVKYNIHFQDFTKNRKPLIISGYLFFVVLNIILNNYADDTIVWKIILNMNHAVMIVFGLAFFVLIAIGICGRSGTHIAEEKNSRIFNLLLKYNFSIYLFHELTLTICRKTVLKIFGSTALVQFASFFILPVIVIAWCILVSMILEKLCPKVFSLITGKRSKKVLN